MKIVIDARFWGPTHTGLGVYTRFLVKELAKLDKSNSYILLTSFPIGEQLPSSFTTKIVNIGAYSLKEQIVLPLILYKINPDLVHFPSINVPLLYFGKYIVTVHDLIKHHSRGPETSTRDPWIYRMKFVCYLLIFQWITSVAKRIIVPSNEVKVELSKKYRLPDDKVVVTYEAATLVKSKNQLSKHYDLPEKYAIYTGNAYPHKNLHNLVLAWGEVFEKTGTVLFISSGRSVFSQRIEKLIMSENAQSYVRYLGYVNDDDLTILYEHAFLYVFPSLLEGFGLPGLDAMKFSLPVVCSDIPVLREVYGDAAQYFDPLSVFDMTKKITEAITDTNLRNKLIESGKKRVKKYSWTTLAKLTLETYESCFSL